MLAYSRNNKCLVLSERSESKGFTLVELLITVSILAVILSVILTNQSKYTDRIALTNLADDIGLSISEAQVYSIGVKESGTGSNEFSNAYGVVFSLLGSGSNNSLISFADRNANKIYDGDWSCQTGGAEECLKKIEISKGNLIESICSIEISGAEACDVGRVDISFIRPNTEAQLLIFDAFGNPPSPNPPTNLAGVRINFTSPGGAVTSVAVYKTGQVSANPPPPGPSVNLAANPSPIPYNTSSTLSWTTAHADSCEASGAWSGSKGTTGSESTGNLISNQSYTLTCMGEGGSGLDSVTVVVTPPSCQGTYLCSQWDGTDSATCTGNGHNCNWAQGAGKCNGGQQSCSPLSQPQCAPIGCSWQ